MEVNYLTHRQRRMDLAVVFGLIAVAVCVTIYSEATFLMSTLLFFGLPALFLSWRRPEDVRKAVWGGLVLGVLLGFSFDFVAEFNHAWGWASNTGLQFPTILGVVSVDILIWYFLWVFLVIMYYEHFVEHVRTRRLSPHARWVVIVGILLASLVITLWHIAPSALTLSYAYAKLGTITFIMCGVLFLRHPQLIKKVIKVTPFFGCLYLAYELTALHMGLWSFPGVYLGEVSFGSLSFPIEEFFVWIIASSAIVATYYEFTIDDDR